ncbi:MerR family transcriptional regulator [Kitasatospora sp. CM 4170]|uniref:MerR family transcriptional regulator n=1 Tax=Kitasatospora aburaviensis TaxID=67265 RepID=A0ABW1ERU9_9ACTN|nr:MerR family transcriptional regulator [Kitasatospora sp. CM 4170]WNM45662.1 MerR family transcriptional regulator [Kitasatospora sp. CM 4170]
MATLASIEIDLRTCSEVFNAPVGVPDRTPRHSISEVAAASGLTAHTLRWYERIGLLDPVDRAASGQRRYCDADLHRLAFLGRLRLTSMPVADMLRYVELAREGERTAEDRRELLVAHREVVRQQIADLHATLAVLDFKIDLYAGRLAACGVPAQTPQTAQTTQTSDRKQQSA